MKFIYTLLITCYYLAIYIAQFINPKAKLWIRGRKSWKQNLSAKITDNQHIAWFHCASLGEFEQGRPVMEAFKTKYPNYKILLTFFSPSGYEVRKHYVSADYICYLPLDTKKNAKEFIEIINPKIAIFVKYEFWYYFINELKQRNIPILSISAIFRENQLFFRNYGNWYRSVLQKFTYIFVQNQKSKDLLDLHTNVTSTVTGDTRFDRVYSIATNAKQLPEIELFKQNKQLIVIGSSWQPDEDLVLQYINQSKSIKYIIAPHEISETNLQRIEKNCTKKIIRYSKINSANVSEFDVLLIDNVGMLSSLYRYGEIAYIGGGFGVGIHNILEAATFGLPIVFGTNYQKFKEAVELMELKSAFSISNISELENKLNNLLKNNDLLKATGLISSNYVKNNIGATNKIINYIEKILIKN